MGTTPWYRTNLNCKSQATCHWRLLISYKLTLHGLPFLLPSLCLSLIKLLSQDLGQFSPPQFCLVGSSGLIPKHSVSHSPPRRPSVVGIPQWAVMWYAAVVSVTTKVPKWYVEGSSSLWAWLKTETCPCGSDLETLLWDPSGIRQVKIKTRKDEIWALHCLREKSDLDFSGVIPGGVPLWYKKVFTTFWVSTMWLTLWWALSLRDQSEEASLLSGMKILNQHMQAGKREAWDADLSVRGVQRVSTDALAEFGSENRNSSSRDRKSRVS